MSETRERAKRKRRTSERAARLSVRPSVRPRPFASIAKPATAFFLPSFVPAAAAAAAGLQHGCKNEVGAAERTQIGRRATSGGRRRRRDPSNQPADGRVWRAEEGVEMKWRRACIACNAFFDLGSVRPRRSPLHLEFGNIDRGDESLDLSGKGALNATAGEISLFFRTTARRSESRNGERPRSIRRRRRRRLGRRFSASARTLKPPP